jgi:putative endonuclease
MNYFVYILQSEIDQSYYIGYSQDVNKRLVEHNLGTSTYTSRKKPWKIVYTESVQTKTEALKRERFLKKQRNKSFYEKLISTNEKN